DYPENSTARQKSEVLRNTNPGCATCHDAIDNIGLALENFDAVGRYRDLSPPYEGSQPIDASGLFLDRGGLGLLDVAGETFSGAAELAEALATSDDVARCIARHWFRFSAHRLETTEEDLRLAAEIYRRAADNGSTLQALFVSLTQSTAFLYRDGTP
ncbi:MAG: DUF1585 domain-containing protein, partial [Myxococcota bacterium]